MRPSYLYNANSYSGKTLCLNWDGPQNEIMNASLLHATYMLNISCEINTSFKSGMTSILTSYALC